MSTPSSRSGVAAKGKARVLRSISTPPICKLPECNLPAARNHGSKKWNKCCCVDHARLIAHRAYAAKYSKVHIPPLRTMAVWGFYREQLARFFGVSTGTICDAAKRYSIHIAYDEGDRKR